MKKMQVIQKAKTTPQSYNKTQQTADSCLATCKKCPPMTC